MAAFDFAAWPPHFSAEQLDELHLKATTYALAHGLLYLPVAPRPPLPTSAIHAPLSLVPSPFPRQLFAFAQKIQSTYNVLYSKIAMDTEFLDRVMGAEQGVGKVDKFTGQLWSGWKQLRDANALVQVSSMIALIVYPLISLQPLQLGLFRSDYLLHHSTESECALRQVEFNTISSSFGTLSERAAQIHRSKIHVQSRFYEFSSFPQSPLGHNVLLWLESYFPR